MRSCLKRFTLPVLAALALFSPTASKADAVRVITDPNNWTFVGAAQVVISGMTVSSFSNNANQRFLATFSAECSVDAPAGNAGAWIDVDIVVLNAGGTVVLTLSPTIGSGDAFCASNGTAGFDGWETNAITAVAVDHDLRAGNYRVQVRARLNGGATGGWFGERSLVVWR
jgi:hypothetical protein